MVTHTIIWYNFNTFLSKKTAYGLLFYNRQNLRFHDAERAHTEAFIQNLPSQVVTTSYPSFVIVLYNFCFNINISTSIRKRLP